MWFLHFSSEGRIESDFFSKKLKRGVGDVYSGPKNTLLVKPFRHACGISKCFFHGLLVNVINNHPCCNAQAMSKTKHRLMLLASICRFGCCLCTNSTLNLSGSPRFGMLDVPDTNFTISPIFCRGYTMKIFKYK